jgi:hypothetical protein
VTNCSFLLPVCPHYFDTSVTLLSLLCRKSLAPVVTHNITHSRCRNNSTSTVNSLGQSEQYSTGGASRNFCICTTTRLDSRRIKQMVTAKHVERLNTFNLLICTVKPTGSSIFEFIEYHSTCFRRSFRPSSGVQDCTHRIRYMSYRLDDFTRWNSFHLWVMVPCGLVG